jgi:hypothetical protein
VSRNKASRQWAQCLATIAQKRAAKNGDYLNVETNVSNDFLVRHVAAWIGKAAERANVPPEILAKRIAGRLI